MYFKPTPLQIEKCIEVYNKYNTKDITLEMLKECRNETGLGLMTIKEIILDYTK